MDGVEEVKTKVATTRLTFSMSFPSPERQMGKRCGQCTPASELLDRYSTTLAKSDRASPTNSPAGCVGGRVTVLRTVYRLLLTGGRSADHCIRFAKDVSMWQC